MSPYAEMCIAMYLYALTISIMAQHDPIAAAILFGSTL